ncbi:MAG: hypothetical protein IK097_02835, partial [Clostridia bacterium]|nr:hypothetical protein [Clostridia bacterium]
AYIAPDSGNVDIDDTVELVGSLMKAAAQTPRLNAGNYADDDGPESTPKPAATPKPTAAPKPSPTPEVHGGYEDGISGKYTIMIDDDLGLSHSEHPAEVTLSKNGGMVITFPVTSTVITNFDTGATVTTDGTARIEGAYDPETHVFAGTGSTDLSDLLINGADFVLTFDADGASVRAAGSMNARAVLWEEEHLYTFEVTLIQN